MDTKLRWDYHREKVDTKATQQFSALRLSCQSYSWRGPIGGFFKSMPLPESRIILAHHPLAARKHSQAEARLRHREAFRRLAIVV